MVVEDGLGHPKGLALGLFKKILKFVGGLGFRVLQRPCALKPSKVLQGLPSRSLHVFSWLLRV